MSRAAPPSPADAELLHVQFESQARSTPSRVALTFGDDSITYAELSDASDRVAAHLHDLAIADGFVGVHIERSIDYVIAVLGVLKSNAAVVPLPPGYPRERLRSIIQFARLEAIIVGAEAQQLNGVSTPVVNLADARRAQAGAVPPPILSAERLRPTPAYVLSSSGSTGTPKLIIRSHASFFHRLRWTWDQHPFDDGERCLQKSHMTTTHAIYELFEPLLRGVPVHIVADADVRQLTGFWDDVRSRGISRLLIVPSMLRASLDLPTFVPPRLKALVLMGERVSSELAARTLAAFPPATRVFSVYGSTEASSALVVDLHESFRPGTELPLGAPISPRVQAYVLDDALQPILPGDVGMLHIAGSALFSGYCGDEARTAAAFVERGGEHLYRTSDRVRVTPDGSLEFVARVDDMVKIRGFRIDLGDVERAISTEPTVERCIVLPRASDTGATSLAAFVTPATVSANAALAAARRELPAHMIPSFIVALSELPLTSSGKVDRQALLAIATRTNDGEEHFASDTEHRVARVVGTVLGRRSISRDASFFEVGGSSLDVAVAVHRLAAEFALDAGALPELAIYQFPRLADLAAHIDALSSGSLTAAPTSDPILVTLKAARGESVPPLFMVSSAGGTLGAYAKLARALDTRRAVIGVRDPYLWGARELSGGFDDWVSRYVDAIVRRQSGGPYHLVAYSSAGAFGYEIARRLRARGESVALLALIDPLALDRGDRSRFGYWALEARFGRRYQTWALRAAGLLRRAWRRRSTGSASDSPNDWRPPIETPDETRMRVLRDCGGIRSLSALLELNAGLPFHLTRAEVDAAGPDGCFDALIERMRVSAPETDPAMIARIAMQYGVQVRSQHNYRLRPYDGAVELFEPAGPFRGLEAAQLRPYVAQLRSRGIPLGEQSRGATVIDDIFSPRIRDHYLCMRDDLFVRELSRQLSVLLGE